MTISLEYAEGAISSITADQYSRPPPAQYSRPPPAQYSRPPPARSWVCQRFVVECYLSRSISVVRDVCGADTL
jgi:hypothetical protein